MPVNAHLLKSQEDVVSSTLGILNHVRTCTVCNSIISVSNCKLLFCVPESRVDKALLLEAPASLNIKRANMKNQWLRDPVSSYISEQATNEEICRWIRFDDETHRSHLTVKTI